MAGSDILTMDYIKQLCVDGNFTDNLLCHGIPRDEGNNEHGAQLGLIIAFSVLIMFGTLGNGLVCYVVFRNPNMRTPRNIFIINLAISDLVLCIFTQPFNIVKASMQVSFL